MCLAICDDELKRDVTNGPCNGDTGEASDGTSDGSDPKQGDGTVTAPSSTDSSCTDLPLFDGAPWADTEGDACSLYAKRSWCLLDGEPGPGWGVGGDTFDDYASSGLSAVDACCACGGGFEVEVEDKPTEQPSSNDSGNGDGSQSILDDLLSSLGEVSLGCLQCPTTFSQVCANGVTFNNPCQANCRGYTEFDAGACPKDCARAPIDHFDPAMTVGRAAMLKPALTVGNSKSTAAKNKKRCAAQCVSRKECVVFTFENNGGDRECILYDAGDKITPFTGKVYRRIIVCTTDASMCTPKNKMACKKEFRSTGKCNWSASDKACLSISNTECTSFKRAQICRLQTGSCVWQNKACMSVADAAKAAAAAMDRGVNCASFKTGKSCRLNSATCTWRTNNKVCRSL
jgi:hypothetical protein